MLCFVLINSVFLKLLEKWVYPKNLHVVLWPNKLLLKLLCFGMFCQSDQSYSVNQRSMSNAVEVQVTDHYDGQSKKPLKRNCFH